MRERLVRSIVLALAATVVLTISAAGGAKGKKEQARVLFKQAVDDFSSGKHKEALKGFEKANWLQPSWKLLYNIAQCQAALMRYGMAIESFEMYLAEGGDDIRVNRRDEVLGELDRLRRMVGEIRIETDRDLVVVIDDVIRGSTGTVKVYPVTAGAKHHVRLVLQEEDIVSSYQTVRGGSHVVIRDQEKGAAATVAPTPVPVDPAAAGTTTAPAALTDYVPPASPATDSKKGVSSVLFWTMAGGAVLFGAGAVAMNFAVKSKKDDGIDSDSTLQQASGMRITGLVSLGLCAATAITAAILIPFTRWGSDKDESPNVSVGVVGTPQGGGLAVDGRF